MSFVETQIIFGVVFACVVILLLVGFFMLLIFVYQRKLRERDRALYKSVIEAEEHERVRIAKELHDSLGASLSSIKLQYDSLKDQISDSTKASLIYSMLDDACKEVRSISHQMMPQIIVEEGFYAALKNFCKPLHDLNKLKFEFYILGSEHDIKDSSKALMLFRIIQELINNSIKHSEASHLLLQISNNENSLNVVVEDNGIGFDQNDLGDRAGLGLSSIRSRVEYIKGSMSVVSTKGNGTSILISLPLN